MHCRNISPLHPGSALFLFLCAALFQVSPAQTKLWEFSGVGKQLRPGGDGSVYVTRSSSASNVWGGPDTLYKLAAAGQVEWTFRLEADRSRVYPTEDGVYVISAFGADTIFYLNSEGAVQWTYAHAFPHVSLHNQCRNGTPLLDAAGNLVHPAIIQTSDETGMTGLSGSLLKIDRAGTVLFEIPLPSFSVGLQPDGAHITREYQGPWVDRTGKIWMVLNTQVSNRTETPKGGITEVARGTIEVMLFSGTNGSLMFRKPVLHVPFALTKTYPDGRGHSTNTHFPFIEDYLVGTDRLVGYGTDGLFTDRVSLRGSRTKEQNWWSVVTIDAAGNHSWFKFKGNGKETWSDRSDVSITDGSSNYLEHAWVADDNSIYLDGEISRGRSRNGVGEIHYDHALIKVGTNKRIGWKKIRPDGIPEYRNTVFFHRGEEKLMLLSGDNSQMTVIDDRGAESLLPLVFSNPLHGFTEFEEGMEHANLEPGIVYGRTSDLTFPSWGVAKYSIPPVAFGPVAGGSGPQDEDQLSEPPSLTPRNYPNPFNPWTTIAFQLEEDAEATITVYNVLGEEIDVLVSAELFGAGPNEVEFDGSSLPTGVYFYRISATGFESGRRVLSTTGRMVLTK